jgi:hypothetical protein
MNDEPLDQCMNDEPLDQCMNDEPLDQCMNDEPLDLQKLYRWEGKCEHTIEKSPDKTDDTGVMLTKPASAVIQQTSKDEVLETCTHTSSHWFLHAFTHAF